ncbi:MAG: DUF2834 domain-containing protein [Cyanobacteria bacterium J06627_15]
MCSTVWLRRLGLGLLWLGFALYAFGGAPPAQSDTLALIQQLSTGQWQGLNPLVVALFNLMGVWPVIYACWALIDGRQQSFPAWPFVAASFAIGAFALLPYLVLRQPASTFTGPKTGLLNFVDSRWVGLGCAIATFSLLIYGLGNGSWSDFIQQWQTSRFIHVMSLDFCLLCGLVPSLLGDDMARRQLQSPIVFWGVTLLPLVGPALYLALRPPLAVEAVPA